MRAIWACRSDVGVKRQINEDNWAANASEQLFVVADGMGGHAGGELASRLVTETIEQFVIETRAGTTEPLPFAPRREHHPEGNRLSVATRVANREIYDTAVRNPAIAGMGSTMVGMLVHGRDAHIVHAGDSRCYLLRGDRLQTITTDHSYVNELIAEGKLAPEQAYKHEERNIITRALGVEPDLEPEVQVQRIRDDDLFLLCTDGLTDKASDRKLLELLDPLIEGRSSESPSSRDIKDRLDKVLLQMIKYANGRGGDDNITAMLVKICD